MDDGPIFVFILIMVAAGVTCAAILGALMLQ